jgi:hypothetical protein
VSKIPWLAAPLLIAVWAAAFSQNQPAPIHFTYRPIDFRLDSCETERRHAPETMAGGVAVFDFNNDGKLDIFFANGADIQTLKKTSAKYSNRLFENDGKGNFKDVTERAGLAGTGYDTGVAIGDYDNDGFQDIFVGGVHGNHLYHNNRDGTFTDVTEKAGIAKPDKQYGPLWSVGGAWVDVNNDGLLDLFVVDYLAWDIQTEPACEAAPGRLDYCHPKFYKATPNQLFLNNGDGTFRDVSVESGIRAHPGKGMGVGIADFDLDGLMDIFVANDKEYNSFFHNKGGGKFEEIAFDADVALTDEGNLISGMGVDARDLDNDGFPDIAFVASLRNVPAVPQSGKAEICRRHQRERHGSGKRAHGRIFAHHSRFRQRWLEGYICLARSRAIARVFGAGAGRAAQFRVPEPGRHEVPAAHGRGGFDGATSRPTPRLGGRRPGWRRPARCGRHRSERSRGDLDE